MMAARTEIWAQERTHPPSFVRLLTAGLGSLIHTYLHRQQLHGCIDRGGARLAVHWICLTWDHALAVQNTTALLKHSSSEKRRRMRSAWSTRDRRRGRMF